ncbi:MAG: hypothetical protein SXA11_07945 [Cyanobacteriota bacterium]|nr:hypothetical protein [Cyanobacteriota bacterium]
MQTLKLKAHIDTNGMLQLQMPPEVKDMDVEILVAFEPKAEEKKVKTAVAKGWQPGFFEKVIGGWQGEPLVREEQGEYEIREELL